MLKKGMTKRKLQLWYNNKRWFSLPIYTNVLSNSLLRMAHLRRGKSRLLWICQVQISCQSVKWQNSNAFFLSNEIQLLVLLRSWERLRRERCPQNHNILGEPLDTFDRGIIVINHPMNVSLDQSFDDGTEKWANPKHKTEKHKLSPLCSFLAQW